MTVFSCVHDHLSDLHVLIQSMFSVQTREVTMILTRETGIHDEGVTPAPRVLIFIQSTIKLDIILSV